LKKILYPFTGILLAVLLTVPILFLRKLPESQATAAPLALKAKGNPDAPIHLVEYSDFQCPSCQTIEMPLNDIMERYSGKIYLIYKHFPLVSHKFSPLAHQAAECANEQGKFWEFHDELYKNQMVWSSAIDPLKIFQSYASGMNLNQGRFARCLENASVAERIQADKREGQAAGVVSTPTFFVNGTMLVGSRQFLENADRTIREKLALEK